MKRLFLFLLLALVVPVNAQWAGVLSGKPTIPASAPAYAGAAGTNSTSAFGTTLTITTTRDIAVGERLLIYFRGANSVATIVDAGGLNTYSLNQLASSSFGELWSGNITNAVSSGSLITITMSGANGNLKIGMLEGFTGIATSSAFDQSSTAENFGSSLSGGTTGTTTQVSELVVAFWTLADPSRTITAGSGYTAFTGAQAGLCIAGEYKFVASTGTQTATATVVGGNTSWYGLIATFKGL